MVTPLVAALLENIMLGFKPYCRKFSCDLWWGLFNRNPTKIWNDGNVV